MLTSEKQPQNSRQKIDEQVIITFYSMTKGIAPNHRNKHVCANDAKTIKRQ
jgi:hypothetical protein